MRLIFIFCILLLGSCYNESTPTPPSKDVYKELKPYLSGKKIGTKQPVNIISSNSSILFSGKNVLNNNRVKETIIYIKPTHVNKTYTELRDWYNTKLKDSLNSNTYNSWRSDSIEYLLLKKGDSSIFANIYKFR